MKKAIVLTLIICVNFSCSKEKDNKNDAGTNTNQQREIVTGSTAKATVEKFYHWYIDEIYAPSTDKNLPDYYQPDIKEIGQGLYKLDTTAYFALLRKQTLFSNKFIENEREIIDACNAELKLVKLTEEAEVVYDVEPCSFLSYNRWVGGQGEDIRSFKVLQTSEVGNTSEVIVSTFDTSNGEFAKIRLLLSKVNNEWKIDKITHPIK